VFAILSPEPRARLCETDFDCGRERGRTPRRWEFALDCVEERERSNLLLTVVEGTGLGGTAFINEGNGKCTVEVLRVS
jgi:hypothetical protein